MKALRLQEFVKLMQISLEEDNPIIFEDTAMYIVNHYGDDYEEDINTGEYVLTVANKSKTRDLQEATKEES